MESGWGVLHRGAAKEARERILEAVRGDAAAYAGLDVATLEKRLARGEQDTRGCRHTRLYADFAEAVKRAVNEAVVRNVFIIQSYGLHQEPIYEHLKVVSRGQSSTCLSPWRPVVAIFRPGE